MSERLTITVIAGGEDADARAFSSVLDDVLDALDAIAGEKNEPGDWRIVALEKNSPAKVVLASKLALFTVLVAGMQQLQAAPSRPFNTDAMKVIQRLSGRIGKQAEAVILEPEGQPEFRLSVQLAQNVKQVLSLGYYEVFASVDGRLDIVNVHAAAKFSVFDEVDGREIRCKFPEKLLDDVKNNIGKRITAVGTVRYNANSDLPVSIKVDAIEPLDDGSPPMLFSEMQPINLAGNLPSEEYIRRMRDGD